MYLSYNENHHLEIILNKRNTMCLILLSFKSHPTYKLIIAANRDEYYDRPTAQATFWEESPDLLAGRDLRAGGTWLGITKKGRTNRCCC